jgi:F-type H+-transporting ATPase subunit epsilon
MNVEIISPDKKLFEGNATAIQLPGSEGSFQLLNNHAPLISTLKAGKIKLEQANNEVKFFEIKSGVVELRNNKVIILVE